MCVSCRCKDPQKEKGKKGDGDKVRLRVWMRGNEEGGKEGEGGKRGK